MRQLDVALDPAKSTQAESPAPDNGKQTAIRTFLSSLEVTDPAAAAYLDQHQSRLVRTLSMLPLGNTESRALELGSYLHMAAATQRVLGYGTVRAAYYGPSISSHAKSLPIKGQPPFHTEVDIFNAEEHVFPYPDCSFDLVLCCELIEHLVHDPMHMLTECWRILADGGLLVITTPNTASLTSVWAVLDGRHNPQVFSRYPVKGNNDTPHVREYTPYELSEALCAAGFEVQALFTERTAGDLHATWVQDILHAHGFDTGLRGEQMYCLARRPGKVVSVERFPGFLYSGQ